MTAWILLFLTWLLYLIPIPGLGPIGWVLNFAAFILAIVVLVKGRTVQGVLQLISAIIISPIVYLVGLAIMAGTAVAVIDAAEKSERSPDRRSTTVPRVFETSKGVEPTQSAGAPRRPMQTVSMELADAILGFVPAADQPTFEWTSAPKEIVWQDSPSVTEQEGVKRTLKVGQMRVNVLGATISKNGEPQVEVPWEVTFLSTQLGGETALQVKFEPNNDCFGKGEGSGCAFELEPSLKRKGIELHKLCSEGWQETYYELRATGRRPVTVRFTQSEGSGGRGAWVTLLVNPSPKAKCGDVDGPCCIG
jgi:hypothetical protein